MPSTPPVAEDAAEARSFWDEPALIVEFYPPLIRRAARALAYLSLMPVGYAVGATAVHPADAPTALLAALALLPAFALATGRPRYGRASVVLCLLGSLLAGLLCWALWRSLGANDGAATWESSASPLAWAGVAALGLCPARIGRLAAFHEACAQLTADRRR
jgi:hypothetical protein